MNLFANGAKETTSEEIPTLEFLLSDDALEGGAMRVIVDDWNSTHDNFKVEINEVAYADIKTQILNRASVNELPALCKTTGFDDYVDFMFPLDDSTLSQDDFVRNTTRDGKFMGTPINSTSVGMIINKTAFDEAGVSYPTVEDERWTWAEFKAAVEEVVAKTDCTYGLVIDHSTQRISNILYQFGMQAFDTSDPTKIAFGSPETLNGFEFIKSLYDDGVSPRSVGLGSEDAMATFKTGKIAAHLSGNWALTEYAKTINTFEWIPVLMPYSTNIATSLGGNYLFAFQGTGYEEMAKEFIEWFYTPEVYTKVCSIDNFLPSMKGINPDYTVEGLEIFNMEINASSSQYNYDESVRNMHVGESYDTAPRIANDMMIAGELTPQEAVEYVVNIIEENFTGVSR